VSDVLLARVVALLGPLPSMPEWRAGAAGGAANPAAPLPAFHTYPLPYVTAIGDHLMALPQQLEVRCPGALWSACVQLLGPGTSRAGLGCGRSQARRGRLCRVGEVGRRAG
jgi:hypothetical protein